MLAVPMSEARTDDTWNVAGLRGPGPHFVEVDDVCVPSERGFRLGRDPSRVSGPLAAFPLGAHLDLYLAVVAIGITRGALDAGTGNMAARASAPGGDVASLAATLDGHPLQRALRDVHAVTLHAQFALERTAAAGRQLVADRVAEAPAADRRSADQG